MEHSALQAGAANQYPPDTRIVAESLGIEPSRASALSTLAVCRLTICLALRWRRDEDSNPMRLVWKQAALPGASRLKIWRRVGDSNSCALAVLQFSGLLGYQLPIPSALLIVGRPGET
jgi:hypothetical protein